MLSGFIITKNNESTILKAISSFLGLCDEIIIVDTGSTDNTLNLIKDLKGIKLYHFEWVNDFSKARNFAISKCSYDWILFIDSDEYFDTKSKQAIKELLKKDCDCWEVIQYSETNSGDYLMCPSVRLFKSGLTFNLPVHETLVDSIKEKNYKVGKSNILLYHSGYKEHNPEKRERNYSIMNESHPMYEYYQGALNITEGLDGKDFLLKMLKKSESTSLTSYIYCLLAETYFKENDIYKAVLCAKQSLTIEPIQNLAKKILADIYFKIGLIDDVIILLQSILINSEVIRCRMFNDRIYNRETIIESLNELEIFKQQNQEHLINLKK